jgi:hypothetical protein
MSEFRARIGRVRMKNGGADVRVLDREAVNSKGEDWRGSVVSNARKIAEQATADAPLVGYLVLGIYGDGCSSIGYRYDYAKSPVPRMLIPAWIAEIVRRDIITEPAAADKFNEMFEWTDGPPA